MVDGLMPANRTFYFYALVRNFWFRGMEIISKFFYIDFGVLKLFETVFATNGP